MTSQHIFSVDPGPEESTQDFSYIEPKIITKTCNVCGFSEKVEEYTIEQQRWGRCEDGIHGDLCPNCTYYFNWLSIDDIPGCKECNKTKIEFIDEICPRCNFCMDENWQNEETGEFLCICVMHYYCRCCSADLRTETCTGGRVKPGKENKHMDFQKEYYYNKYIKYFEK